ncbi:hypothetical protein AAMO2058_000585800 [Amorphochlora amoebiformis]
MTDALSRPCPPESGVPGSLKKTDPPGSLDSSESVTGFRSITPSMLARGLLIGLSAALACSPSRTNVVQTSLGPIQGYVRCDGSRGSVEVFEGIPFAAPPVGENRFRAPQPPSTWTELKDTVKVKPACPQIRLFGDVMYGDEDCLYLNIYKPAHANESSSLPVFFWIFGGGYTLGDGSEFTIYDGTNLAATHDYIVVTFNYRLNILGFLALPELKQEDPHNSTGNYALQDQRQALQFVRDNIRTFGGDPERITIAGESAGGFSVMWHLVSEQSKGMFSSAIMQAGTNQVEWWFQPEDRAFNFYENTSSILDCKDPQSRLECLRKIPVEQLLIPISQWLTDALGRNNPSLPIPKTVPAYGSDLFPVMPYAPTIDNSPAGLQGTPIELVRKGQKANVPLLLGANKNSGNLLLEGLLPFMVPGTMNPPGNETLYRATYWFVGDKSRELRDLYSAEEYKSAGIMSYYQRIADSLRDCMFRCSDRRLAREWVKSKLPTYMYTFSFDLGPIDHLLDGGDFHVTELPFEFKNLLPELALLMVPNPWKISNTLSCLWARFIYCNDPNKSSCNGVKVKGCDGVLPNPKSEPLWPDFSDSRYPKGVYLSLKKQLEVVGLQENNLYPNNEFPSDKKCDFWDVTPVSWHPLRSHPYP